MRLLPVVSQQGEITPSALLSGLGRGHGVYGVQPVALTLTQPTELARPPRSGLDPTADRILRAGDEARLG
jgi:hypothetical protein